MVNGNKINWVLKTVVKNQIRRNIFLAGAVVLHLKKKTSLNQRIEIRKRVYFSTIFCLFYDV